MTIKWSIPPNPDRLPIISTLLLLQVEFPAVLHSFGYMNAWDKDRRAENLLRPENISKRRVKWDLGRLHYLQHEEEGK